MRIPTNRWLYTSTLLVIGSLIGFICFPGEHGFGIASMYVFPVTFLAGLVLMIPALYPCNAAFTSLKISIKSDALRFTLGAFAFVCSLLVYAVTVEPTASLWDCSEFIAAAYKLQVPHTPGNPLLLLIGKVFSMLSFGDNTKVAWWINMMSALFAAATVWLLFEIILLTTGKKSKIGAFAGSMCLAFSDTFWFSATEAETYAASSFFILLMVWIALLGAQSSETISKEKLPLFGYIAGLSFCIHPMAILAIPVVSVILYLKKGYSLRQWLKGLAIGVILVLAINRFIAVGLFELAFNLDLILVNHVGLPFFSGAILLLFLVIAAVRLCLKRFLRFRPLILAGVLYIVGMLPYAVLFIRSAHNPPIDECNPENPQLIKAYMNREGYPSRPLLFGPYFDAKVESVNEGSLVYYTDGDQYKIAGSIPEYQYTKGRQTFLPRIYSNDADHIQTYRSWTSLRDGELPGFKHNLEFMFKYQIGHMYLRYLMFNFAGRSGDDQGSGWLKPWEERSFNELGVHNSKARNQYWMIPLVIGVAGAFLQYRKNKEGFAMTLSLFAITGLLLAIYLNSTPNEPRERDYIYVGSFIAFCVWIGACFSYTTDEIRSKYLKYVLRSITILVPAWMCYENYDDHNRTGRTLQIDNARNVLASCEPNSILFTGGDNDTFPLWYLQDVEAFRTDVRVMVLSYMNTDWYINQLTRQYYESKPFKFTLNENAYRQYGANDVLYVKDQFPSGVDAAKFLQLLNERHSALTVQTGPNDAYSIAPAKKFIIPTSDNDSDSSTTLEIKGNYLQKNGLAILDLIVNNPDRPVHFNFTSANQTGFILNQNLVSKGQIYKWQPHGMDSGSRIDTKTSYRNLIERMDYSTLLDKDLYLNVEDHQNRIVNPLRMSVNELAIALIQERQNELAENVMAHARKFLYAEHLRPSFATLQAAEILKELDDHSTALELAEKMYAYCNAVNKTTKDPLNEQLLRYATALLRELDEGCRSVWK